MLCPLCVSCLGCTDAADALRIVDLMDQRGIKIDAITYTSLLTVCANSNALSQGKQIHQRMIANNITIASPTHRTALIKLYSKCGDLKTATSLFNEWRSQQGKLDLTVWTSLISGFILSNLPLEALKYFDQMKREGVIPDDVLYICVISACLDSGNLDTAKLLHKELVDNAIKISLPLYNALLKLYSKTGDTNETQSILQQIRKRGMKPDQISYICSLTACANASNLTFGSQVLLLIICVIIHSFIRN